MKDHLTIGIADNDVYWRSIIINYLNRNKNNRILFTTINGYDLLKQAIKFTPQLLIIDSHMPLLCGIEAAIGLKPQLPQTKIICLSMVYQQNISEQLLNNGVEGYTTKDCDLIGLNNAIKDVLLGKQYYKNNNSPDEEIKRIKQQVDGIESYKLSPTPSSRGRAVRVHMPSLIYHRSARNNRNCFFTIQLFLFSYNLLSTFSASPKALVNTH